MKVTEVEKPQLDIGFVPLTDCAPLVAAHEKGFFEAEGLRVTLHRERSWASIRDKTAFSVFDAAQMLYPMPLAMSLGIGGMTEPTVTATCLSLGGNAITVSKALSEAMRALDPGATAGLTAEPLRKVIAARRAAGESSLTFGIVFPTSTHAYELRYWMAASGIDPDSDVTMIVLPPPDMPEALRTGLIDGFCVGEPWNSFVVQRGWGRIVITKQELWNNAPEKVLGVTGRWADRHPKTHEALVRAVLGACAWCDEAANRAELARLIAEPSYVDAPLEVIRAALTGPFQREQAAPPHGDNNHFVFHRHAANFPWRSHAAWYLTQMVRWGQVKPPDDLDATAAAVLRPDVFRAAAAAVGVTAPLIDSKPEGRHPAAWTLTEATAPIEMGPDRFFEGSEFELVPGQPIAFPDHRGR